MSEKLPTVSVVLPTHDRMRLFQRALASVLGQTLQDIEVIVIDNACTDGTSAWLATVADPRVRVLRLDRKVGASAARNAALKLARADLVAFQDDDDIWLPDKMERQVTVLQESDPSVGLCLAGYVRLTPGGTQDRYDQRYSEVDFNGTQGMLGINAIATPAWLVRRELLERAGGFDEKMPARNDWELALRLSDLCRFVYVAEPLFVQDQRVETTMMYNEAAVTRGVRRVVEIHGHRWAQHPRTRAHHAMLIGRYELSAGDTADGRRWLGRSLRLNPWQPRVALLLLLSFLGQGSVRRARALRQQLYARLPILFR